MADINTFNPELDKITEREMVYDIVNRLRIGRNITNFENDGDILFHPPMKLEEIISRLVMMNKESIALNIEGINYTIIKMNVGDKTKTVSHTSKNNIGTLGMLAISERTGVDLTSMLTTTVNSKTVKITLTVDTPYTTDDIIKVYYWNK